MKKQAWAVYIIHFYQKYKHAQHYLGISNDVNRRYKEHIAGRGSRLIQVVLQAGINISPPQVIKKYPRIYCAFRKALAEEKRLKNNAHPKRICPICQKIKKYNIVDWT